MVIKYRPSKENSQVNVLSRRPNHKSETPNLNSPPIRVDDYRDLQLVEDIIIAFISIIENLTELKDFKAVYLEDLETKD